MSHLSTITNVALTNLSALERALRIANQKRNLLLQLNVGVAQTIRAWDGITQSKRYTAVIRCNNLNADIGLAFVPNTDQKPGAHPIIENNILQNGHFVLEADMMMLGPLGPRLNLITNLYSATLIQATLGDANEEGENLQMQLQDDNTILLAN